MISKKPLSERIGEITSSVLIGLAGFSVGTAVGMHLMAGKINTDYIKDRNQLGEIACAYSDAVTAGKTYSHNLLVPGINIGQDDKKMIDNLFHFGDELLYDPQNLKYFSGCPLPLSTQFQKMIHENRQ